MLGWTIALKLIGHTHNTHITLCSSTLARSHLQRDWLKVNIQVHKKVYQHMNNYTSVFFPRVISKLHCAEASTTEAGATEAGATEASTTTNLLINYQDCKTLSACSKHGSNYKLHTPVQHTAYHRICVRLTKFMIDKIYKKKHLILPCISGRNQPAWHMMCMASMQYGITQLYDFKLTLVSFSSRFPVLWGYNRQTHLSLLINIGMVYLC